MVAMIRYPKPFTHVLNAAITAAEQCLENNNFEYTFNATTQDTLKYTWLVDNQQYNTQQIAHQFANVGNKAIALTILANEACEFKFNTTALVKPNATPHPITGDSVVREGALSIYTVDSTAGYMYKWIVSNGVLQSNDTLTAAEVLWSTHGVSKVAVASTLNGCSVVDSLLVRVEPNVGLTTYDELKGVSIYPNPNDGNFTVSLTASKAQNISVKLYNVLGALVYEKDVNAHAGANIITLNNELPSGVYFVQLNAEGGT
jgi:hypothetical protein